MVQGDTTQPSLARSLIRTLNIQVPEQYREESGPVAWSTASKSALQFYKSLILSRLQPENIKEKKIICQGQRVWLPIRRVLKGRTKCVFSPDFALNLNVTDSKIITVTSLSRTVNTDLQWNSEMSSELTKQIQVINVMFKDLLGEQVEEWNQNRETNSVKGGCWW